MDVMKRPLLVFGKKHSIYESDLTDVGRDFVLVGDCKRDGKDKKTGAHIEQNFAV